MMKITLLWGCIGLIWGNGCAVLAEREFYPGLNYEFTPFQSNPVQIQAFIPENYYDVTYKRVMPTWQRRSIPMDAGLEADDVTEYLEKGDFDADGDYNELVKLYNLLQYARKYARNHGLARTPQLTGRRAEIIKHLEEKYEKLKEAANMNEIDFLDKYVLNPAPEEARMYPQEDGDMDWNEENDDKIYTDTEERIPSLADQQRLHYENAVYGSYGKIHPTYNGVHENIMKDVQTSQNVKDIKEPQIHSHQPLASHNMHEDHENYVFKENEEFPSSDLSNIPIAENPSEFGFGPSDPRFFEKNSAEQASQEINEFDLNASKNQKPKILDQPEKTKLLKVKDRSKTSNNIFPSEEETAKYRQKPIGDNIDVVAIKQPDISSDSRGIYIIAIIAGISAAATVGLIAVGIGWYNLQKHMKNAEDTDYPSYGIVGPNKDHEKKHRDEAGDRKLAQSAQMYHYQHQKQQIIAMGRNPQGGHGSMSETDEEEDEEGNYTVYECPGLASIEGPLEVKNPMFDDDQLVTPSQTPSKATNEASSK